MESADQTDKKASETSVGSLNMTNRKVAAELVKLAKELVSAKTGAWSEKDVIDDIKSFWEDEVGLKVINKIRLRDFWSDEDAGYAGAYVELDGSHGKAQRAKDVMRHANSLRQGKDPQIVVKKMEQSYGRLPRGVDMKWEVSLEWLMGEEI